MASAPRTDADKQTQKRSNEHLCNREELTPVYQSQNFKPPKTLTAEERVVWKWLTKVFRETVNCRVSDADVHLIDAVTSHHKIAKPVQSDSSFLIL